jgi:hypothetical protein
MTTANGKLMAPRIATPDNLLLRAAVACVLLALGARPAEAATLKGTSSFGVDFGVFGMFGSDASAGLALAYQRSAHRLALGFEQNLNVNGGFNKGSVLSLKYGYAPVQLFGHVTPVFEVGYATGGYVPMCYDMTTPAGLEYSACGVLTPFGGPVADLLLDVDLPLSRRVSLTFAAGGGAGWALRAGAGPYGFLLVRGGLRLWK